MPGTTDFFPGYNYMAQSTQLGTELTFIGRLVILAIERNRMRLEHAESSETKGWLIGPWNSKNELSIGYANTGLDEPHVHGIVTEIYLVGQGNAVVRVNKQTINICAEDVLQIEPGEGHSFRANTEDYFHFVIHHPGLAGNKARVDKRPVSRKDLGL